MVSIVDMISSLHTNFVVFIGNQILYLCIFVMTIGLHLHVRVKLELSMSRC